MPQTKKNIGFKESDIISASEIGQYFYCPVAWYLQKCGNKPISPFLEKGNLKHFEIGKIINKKQVNEKKSRILAFVGYVLLISAIFIILFEVIL